MSGILLIHGGNAHARRVMAEQGRAYWPAALRTVLEKHGHLELEEAGPEVLADDARLERAAAVLVAGLPPGAWPAGRAEALAERRVPVLVEGPLPPELDAFLGMRAGESLAEDGAVMVVEPGLRSAASEYGVALGALLSEPRRQPLDRDRALDWDRLGVPIGGSQAAAWRARGWDVVEWTREGEATVLCEWVGRSSGDRHPAVVRRGTFAGCSFGLFAFLAQRHTVEPFEGAEWRSTDRSIGLEVALLGLIDEMYRRRGVTRARVLPWPRGRQWARTVRHDVVGPVSAPEAAGLLGAHGHAGTRATFYCVPGTTGHEAVSAGGAEVALLAERLWGAETSEAAALAAATGARPRGVAARSSSHCFRHQGAPNVLWAEREQLDYTELTGRSHAHPHRFPVLEADGTVRLLDVLCLPASEGLDYYASHPDKLVETAEWWEAMGGLWNLAAGPKAGTSVRALAASGGPACAELTAAEAVEWWRRSHLGVTLRHVDAGTVEVTADGPVHGLGVELLSPAGRRIVHHLDAGPEPVQLAATGEAAPMVTWDETLPHFRRAVNRHQGGAAGTLKSLETVGARGEWLLERLRALSGRDALEGATVVDIGCGLGGISLYVAWRARPERVYAIDGSRGFLAVGRDVAEATGLDEVVRFSFGDLRSAPQVPDGSADVVLAIGVLMYMLNPLDLQRALRELHRMLAPGGTLLVHQATRWQARDPQTGRRLAHLVPWPGSLLVRRREGSQYKRWISPPEILAQLRAAGFRDLRLAGSGDDGWHEKGLVRLRDPYYAVAATKRGGPPPVARPAGPPPRREQPDWEPLSSAFFEAIEAHYAETGAASDAASRRVTLRTNTELVPQRGDLLLQCLDELLGLPSLSGLRVLEVGSGFGALAAYLATAGRAARLTATDLDERYLAVARDAAERAGLADRLRFAHADMRDLSAFGDGAFDVVIANNSFIYLTEPEDVNRALGEFRRVLAPAGCVLFYHANKWRLREPFTGDPVVHLLPPALAERVAARKGWRHNHGRVRLLSPPELRRRLRRQGFEVAATRGYTNPPSQVGLRRNFGTFYALAARVPPG